MTHSITTKNHVKMGDYVEVMTLLTLFTVGLLAMVSLLEPAAQKANAVIAPLLALMLLTGIVWVIMVITRNLAVLRGLVSAQYFVDYSSKIPDEYLERPARTFNNLLQVPLLFYVIVLLILHEEAVDRIQWLLAWVFVATRYLHAIVYMVFNVVKYRFTCWMLGCITLVFITSRFAIQGL